MLNQKLIDGRHKHSSVLLAGTQILTMGGRNEIGSLQSTELLSLESAVVQPREHVPVDVGVNVAAAILHTRVFACGGSYSVHGKYYTHCINFNGTNWGFAKDMEGRRENFPMVASNGKLFVFGGSNGAMESLSSVQRYDEVGNKWEYVSPMPTARHSSAAAPLNGWIFVCGGSDGTTVLNTCERYDPATNRWDKAPNMTKVRYGHSLVAMGGQLYALGGNSSRRETERSVEMCDPVWKERWILLSAKLMKKRLYASAVAVEKNKVKIGKHSLFQ